MLKSVILFIWHDAIIFFSFVIFFSFEFVFNSLKKQYDEILSNKILNLTVKLIGQ